MTVRSSSNIPLRVVNKSCRIKEFKGFGGNVPKDYVTIVQNRHKNVLDTHYFVSTAIADLRDH